MRRAQGEGLASANSGSGAAAGAAQPPPPQQPLPPQQNVSGAPAEAVEEGAAHASGGAGAADVLGPRSRSAAPLSGSGESEEEEEEEGVARTTEELRAAVRSIPREKLDKLQRFCQAAFRDPIGVLAVRGGWRRSAKLRHTRVH